MHIAKHIPLGGGEETRRIRWKPKLYIGIFEIQVD